MDAVGRQGREVLLHRDPAVVGVALGVDDRERGVAERFEVGRLVHGGADRVELVSNAAAVSWRRQEGALLIAFRRWQVAVWNAGQAHWVPLASSAQLISVDHTSHNIQLDRPDVVLDKIHELLQ